ncbi:hypothetical protein HP548_12015 [Paenibacillus taichungensis]|uniref:Peptidase n=1 Tax=Paenibacillus taichungensis TaxID=484184 RepID=A0ABX2ML73_9BACL|nr:hypothetical protein [Paenibacillus taichungensis]NUU54804.1 hypothetical protein [Paenibacillus taichungensis]
MQNKYRFGVILSAGIILSASAVFATNHVLNAESVLNNTHITASKEKTAGKSLNETSSTKTASNEVIYPINEQGQTLGEGPLMPGKTQEPDLIKAENENGVQGYIKTSDLESGATSPEEALDYQKSKDSSEFRYIPLYKSDGKTIIGEFKVGGSHS